MPRDSQLCGLCCPEESTANSSNTFIRIKNPRRRNVTTLMVGLKKRSHTQKSHPKVVNPRDIAGERKKKKIESKLTIQFLHFTGRKM